MTGGLRRDAGGGLDLGAGHPSERTSALHGPYAATVT